MHEFLDIEKHTWNYYCIDVRRLRILGTYEYEYTFPASVGVPDPSLRCDILSDHGDDF